jgi:uncharacterized coiled-coil DUF342 family protein
MADNEKEQTLVEKYPELRAVEEKLKAERDAVVKQSAPLRAKRDALAAQIQPVENQIRELNQAIKAIEQPRIAEIDNQLGAIAKATGGKSLQADAPVVDE